MTLEELEQFFNDLDTGASWSAGVSFKRTNPLPLDKYSVFPSLIKAQEYASSNPVAYPGQIIAVAADGASSVYYINDKMKLTEVGSKIEVDNETIVNKDGKLALAAIPVDAAEKTYQPVMVKGKLTWQVPSATTVEGLDTRLTTAEEKITNLETTVGDSQKGLVKDVADIQSKIDNPDTGLANAHTKADKNAGDIVTANGKISALEADNTTNKADITKLKEKDIALDGEITKLQQKDTELQLAIDGKATKATTLKGYGITDAYTKGEADTAISSAVADASHLKRVVLESEAGLPDASSKEAENTIYMVPRVVVKQKLLGTAEEKVDAYVEYMALNGKWEIIGSTAVDLTDYAKTKEVNDKLALKADKTALDDYAKKTEVDDKLKAYTNTSDMDSALAKKVDVVDGSRLMTNDEGAKLKGIAAGAQVNAIDKVSIDFTIGEGKELQLAEIVKASIANIDNKVDKVKGKGLSTHDLTDELKDKYDKAQENFVKSVVAEEFTVRDGQLAINQIAASKVTGLPEALVKSVEETELKVDEAGKLSVVEIAQGKVANLTTDLAAKLAKTELDGAITALRGSNDALLSTQDREHLAAAEANKLEGVKVNGAALQIAEDKTVSLPIALQSALGLVKGNEAENGVVVAEDGSMSVHSLNVNKLTQREGEWVTLQGGNASLGTK